VSVGNLMAGEEATVEVRYGQLLSFVQGQVRIAIPTVIAPRYGDAGAACLAPHAIPETALGADYPARFVVELGGELANGTAACPSHAATSRRVDERFVVELEGRLDRDFIVTIDGLAGRPLATVAPDGDGWVALASFLPTLSAPAKETSLTLKVLVDCSGSMNGSHRASTKSSTDTPACRKRPASVPTFNSECIGITQPFEPRRATT